MYDELLGTPGQVTEEQLKMVILETLPPSFDRMTSAWDSVPPAERTVLALTNRLLIEERRTLTKYNGEKHPDDIAFFAGPTARDHGYAAQSY